MIDIHMHILPGIDDGAQDIYDSLAMADLAIQSGITDVICTSHSSTDRWFAADYEYAFERLSDALKKERLPLRIYPGMEIYLEEESCAWLKNGSFLTLNHTKHVLVETDFEICEEKMQSYLKELIQEGYHPILAHAERFHFVQKHPETIRTLRAMGCEIQINKGTLSGVFGHGAKKLAENALREKLVDYVATDAHDVRRRTPYMGNAKPALQELIEQDYERFLLEEHPAQILQITRGNL